MKNFSRFSILAVVLLGLAGSAAAVDLVTFAVVDIVEGITVTQTTPLNFGVLVKNDGVVVITAQDGSYTNADNIVIDGSSIAQGVFVVDSAPGADIEVACSAGAMPPGLALSAFTASWDNGADAVAIVGTPATHTIVGASVGLEIGATLTVTGNTVAVANAVQLPYTVAVTFQ